MTEEPPRKLLYIFDHTDWKSRLPLAKAGQKEGWDVTIGIVGNPEDTNALEGLKHATITRPEGRLTLFSILKTILSIRNLIEQEKPNLVHTVTIKYAFFLGLASLFKSNYRIIYTLAGLGFLFRGHGRKPEIIRAALSPFLKFILRNRKAQVIFQNPDDMKLMIEKNYVKEANTHLVISSGVDLEKFKAVPPPAKEEPLVLMPTRLVREKGIHIFIEAARLLKLRGIRARFEIAGGETHHNPSAISKKEMEQITSDSSTHWLGHVDNMTAILTKADIIVYPSYYGEGVPRVLLEAAAAGRPIITTDHPGCREAVEDGSNGFLVPIKDVNAIANAIELLLNDSEKRLEMGHQSRLKAQNSFDLKRIVYKTLEVYQTAMNA